MSRYCSTGFSWTTLCAPPFPCFPSCAGQLLFPFFLLPLMPAEVFFLPVPFQTSGTFPVSLVKRSVSPALWAPFALPMFAMAGWLRSTTTPCWVFLTSSHGGKLFLRPPQTYSIFPPPSTPLPRLYVPFLSPARCMPFF